MPDLVVHGEELWKTIVRNALQSGNEIACFETALGEVLGQDIDCYTLGKGRRATSPIVADFH